MGVWMNDLSFKHFKIRYFVLFAIVLVVITVVVEVTMVNIPHISEWTQLFLSVGLTLYLIWQTKAKQITYEMEGNSDPMTARRWIKYVVLTIGTKLYAQTIVVFLGTVIVVLLFDFMKMVLEFVGDIEIVTSEASLFNYVITFILICILAPIWEELFFRGIVLRRLMMKWSAPVSIVLSSILFGLFHFNVVQIVYAFIIGLLLGFIYLRTGNIIIAMVLHSVSNFVSFIFIVIDGGQSNDNIIEQFMLMEKQVLVEQLVGLSIASLLLSLIFGVVVWKCYQQMRGIPKLVPIKVEDKEVLDLENE